MEALPLRAGGEIDRIIDRYQDVVYGLALARTGSRADADDVFQEVFLAYHQSGKTFRDEEHRKAWLLRTTVNQCRRVTSSSWRRKTVPLSEREDAPVRFQEPEENRVWEALQNLTEDYRLPLYLFYVQAGKRIALDEAVDDMGEDLVHPIVPGGAVVPEDDGNPIADGHWVDGDYYDDVERLPEQKRPAVVQSVPEEEEGDPLTAVTYDVETGEITVHPYPYSEESEKNVSRSTAPFNPNA